MRKSRDGYHICFNWLNLKAPERERSLPKPGTNPRGPEFSKEALLKLIQDSDTKSIEIEWHRSKIKYEPYERWIAYWAKDKMPYDTKEMQTKIE